MGKAIKTDPPRGVVAMELSVTQKSKKSITLEIVNPDDTVIYPLISRLLKDKRVEDARYITGHPLLDKPKISVKVKEGDPKVVIEEKALELAAGYGELKAQVLAFTGEGKDSKKA